MLELFGDCRIVICRKSTLRLIAIRGRGSVVIVALSLNSPRPKLFVGVWHMPNTNSAVIGACRHGAANSYKTCRALM